MIYEDELDAEYVSIDDDDNGQEEDEDNQGLNIMKKTGAIKWGMYLYHGRRG